MKRRYKVLPLPDVFLGGNEIREKMRANCLHGSHIVPVVFNRPGFYLDRATGETWVEFDGQAWSYLNAAAFQYDLEQADGEKWMDEHVYQALGVVLDAGLGDGKLRKLHQVESDRRLLHRNQIAARSFRLGVRRRLAAFLKKLGK